MHAHQLYDSQFQYDNATPEDPPEAPDFYWEAKELAGQEDSHLVSQEEFIEHADERIHDLLPEGYLISFLLNCANTNEPNTRMLAKPIREALEQIAGEMLLEAHEKAIKEKDDEQ